MRLWYNLIFVLVLSGVLCNNVSAQQYDGDVLYDFIITRLDDEQPIMGYGKSATDIGLIIYSNIKDLEIKVTSAVIGNVVNEYRYDDEKKAYILSLKPFKEESPKYTMEVNHPAYRSQKFRFTHDDLDKNYASRRRYIVQRYFYILCYWVSNSCIIVSQADMKNVLRVLAKKGKLTFSEHTIEIDKFVINAFEEKDKLFSTIVWMGNENNVKRKGVDRALKVFSHLKKYKQFEDYKFIIIGKKGEGTAYLLDLINKYMLSESVYFTDEISEEEKINFLKRSKYYFQLSEYEGFGLAALEALASKNIVIHSAKGGLTNPIFSAGIHFNIDENPDIECENLFNQLLNYDNSKLTETTQVIKCYYNNTRRKHDFEKILND